jgi:hypothetical protein
MLNGYSGIRPDSYDATYEALRSFPDDGSLIALHDRGVTHVIVHGPEFAAAFGRDRYEAIGRRPSMELFAEDADIHIFRLR